MASYIWSDMDVIKPAKEKKKRSSAAAHKSKKRDILSKRVHDPSKLPRSASTWQWIGTRVLFALKIYDQLYGRIKSKICLLDERYDRPDQGIVGDS